MDAIDFNVLQKAYFQWDLPVEYKLKNGSVVNIYPILTKDSEIFLSSIDVLLVDKNKIPDPQIISMSNIDFILTYLFSQDDMFKVKLLNIFRLCLKWNDFKYGTDNRNRGIITSENEEHIIKSKEFNDIKRIILYQNIVGYDDEYINPELQEAMEESDRLKNMNLEMPNLERKNAIISAHNGMPKSELANLTFREHTMIFNEVCGETNHLTTWPIALYSGETNKIEHWIFKKKQGKLDGYITERNQFARKLGANPNYIKQSSDGDSLDNMYMNFNK